MCCVPPHSPKWLFLHWSHLGAFERSSLHVSMRVAPDASRWHLVVCATSYLQGVCRKAGSSWAVFSHCELTPPPAIHISYFRSIYESCINPISKYPNKEINTTDLKFTDNSITAGFLVDIIMSFNKGRAFWNIRLCSQDRFLSCITIIRKEVIKENKTDWQCCAANRQRRNRVSGLRHWTSENLPLRHKWDQCYRLCNIECVKYLHVSRQMSPLVCKQWNTLYLATAEYLGYISSHLASFKNMLRPRSFRDCLRRSCRCRRADRTLGDRFPSNDAAKATVKQIRERLLCLQTWKGELVTGTAAQLR